MSDWIIISGVHPWDGRYELDLDEAPFTTREWGWIKKHAGYLPVTLGPDEYTDPELIAVLAIIAMRRNGKIENSDVTQLWDRFQDAPFGATIQFEFGDREQAGDADGPPTRSSDSNASINGDSSRTSSVSSDGPRSRTGSPASATSASAPQISVS